MGVVAFRRWHVKRSMRKKWGATSWLEVTAAEATVTLPMMRARAWSSAVRAARGSAIGFVCGAVVRSQ
jgi:hypothetical protein